MGLYVGDQNVVVFKYESGTYGSPSGTGQWIGLVTDHTPSDDEGIQVIRYAGLANRNRGLTVQTTKDYEGTLTYHPQDFRMFAFALGSCVDAGSPSPYTHVISELNNGSTYAFTSGANHNFPSFTVVDVKKVITDGQHLVRTYQGCLVDSLSISFPTENAATCELTYSAQSLTIGSQVADIPTYTQDTSRPYIWSDVSFHLPSGTVMSEVTDLSFSINNNLNRRHYDNGSSVVENITPENRDYEVTITMDANSSWGKPLYEQYWQGGSLFNCMMRGVISTGSETFAIIMSGCRISDFQAPSPSEGINEFNITISPQSAIINVDDLNIKYNPY